MAATPLRASRALTPGDWDGSERASERSERSEGWRRSKEEGVEHGICIVLGTYVRT